MRMRDRDRRPTATVTTGLAAGTLVETQGGWRPVETLHPGEAVQTWDGGLRPVLQIRRAACAGGLILLSGGLLDTCSDLPLLPGQHLLIDREEAALAVGIPVALLPARALIGLPGIGFARAGAAVFTLIFEAEEVVYANSGALLHCPSCRMDPQQAPKSDFFTVMRPDQRPALLKAIGQGMAPVRNVRKVPLAA